ncbi:hypothetical protein ACP4OV_010415 [Aristida adscensionis]
MRPKDHHHGLGLLHEMEDAKRAAVEEFCRVAGQPREAVLGSTVLPLAGTVRRCYEEGDTMIRRVKEDDRLAEMMLLDGCFLLQFMVSMCPGDPGAQAEADPFMSRPEVHGNIDAIARDVLLLENQIPWPVLQALMDLRPGVPVLKFLDRMASAFDISNSGTNNPSPISAVDAESRTSQEPPPPPPPRHLFGLFHRRQVGAARTESNRVPVLSSLGSTAVELAEMGVKLTASKTKKFGDMSMAKRRPGLAVFAELSLAPLVLNDLTACWLLNMVAYEASVSATEADNFAVSSYVTLIALLINREGDVQELRAKGIINSTMSDEATLAFFKWAARNLRVGHRYYDIFKRLHEYKQERWMWIAIHGFFYRNIKTIVAVLSAIGVLVGLFKAILSLKQPNRG